MNWNNVVIIKISEPIIMKLDYKVEIINQGYWYHENSPDPLQHMYSFSDDGLIAKCSCGYTLKYTENFLPIG